MQSHKRPHELSDIFLKNISESVELNPNRLSAVPIIEVAILPRLVLLSSVCFVVVSEETLKQTMGFPTHQPSRSVAEYSTEC